MEGFSIDIGGSELISECSELIPENSELTWEGI